MRPANDKYQLPAKLWEATLYDVIGNIHAVQAACIEKVLSGLGLRYELVAAKKSVAQLVLESREWMNHPRLRTLVRKFWVRGYTQVSNQIVLKEYNCQTDSNGIVWLQFSGLHRGKVLRIPTTLKAETTGQLRLIKRDSKWYIHYSIDVTVAPKRTEGIDIGIDRGYSEVYVTSTNDGGRFIGKDNGCIQTKENDERTQKGAKRNKLRSIAEKAKKKGYHAKAERIARNNLGNIKWNRREAAFKGRIQTLVFTATIELIRDGIKAIGYEDLTEQITSKKKRSRRTKRNLNTWCKGVVVKALYQVSSRVGCTLVGVCAAYTSQVDSRHGILLGERVGDKFTCFDGVVLHADINAADAVEARMGDDEITRFMKHTVVKEILLQRTRKFLEALLVTQAVWDSVFEAVLGKDTPKALEPKRKREARRIEDSIRQTSRASRVNQSANHKQLTLFDYV